MLQNLHFPPTGLDTIQQEPRCDFRSPSSRVDCGYPGIERDECVARKCCWDTATRHVPWCFYGENVHDDIASQYLPDYYYYYGYYGHHNHVVI